MKSHKETKPQQKRTIIQLEYMQHISWHSAH